MAVDSPPSNPAPPAPTRAEATRKGVASETPKSPPAPPTPAAIEGLDSSEMEVDVEGIQDDMDVQGGDSEAGPDTSRNPGDDEIIRQLEKGLPKWPGASDKGWMHEVSPVGVLACVLMTSSPPPGYRTGTPRLYTLSRLTKTSCGYELLCV